MNEIKSKLFDACILIETISAEFPDLYYRWIEKYKLLIPAEVLSEVKTWENTFIKELIEKNIIAVLDKVPNIELERLKKENPILSEADCAVLYYSLQLDYKIDHFRFLIFLLGLFGQIVKRDSVSGCYYQSQIL